MSHPSRNVEQAVRGTEMAGWGVFWSRAVELDVVGIEMILKVVEYDTITQG